MIPTLKLLALIASLVLVGTTGRLDAAPIPLGNGITVDCQMSDASPCVLVPGSNPLKWVILEGANDATPQPGIALFFNVPFINVGAFNMLDPNGTTISDQVSFFNFPQNNNNGVVDFFSDPNVNILNLPNLPVGCTETTIAGCSFDFVIQTAQGHLKFTAFSDGDNPPAGAFQSDTISVVLPEPSAWLLLVTGIMGLLALGGRRPARQ